jgi:hypothetical protein
VLPATWILLEGREQDVAFADGARVVRNVPSGGDRGLLLGQGVATPGWADGPQQTDRLASPRSRRFTLPCKPLREV